MKKIFSILILCFVTMLLGCGKKSSNKFLFDSSQPYEMDFYKYNDAGREKIKLEISENDMSTLKGRFLPLVKLDGSDDIDGVTYNYLAVFSQDDIKLYIKILSNNSDGTSWRVSISEYKGDQKNVAFTTDLNQAKNTDIEAIYTIMRNYN